MKRIQELTEEKNDMDEVELQAMKNVIANNNLQSELEEEIKRLLDDYDDLD